jgi:putative ABC transport system permease protein
MQEAQVQDMKNTYGSWHVMYKKVDDSLITKIKSNPVVLRSGTYATGSETNISSNLKVREVFGSDDGLKLLPYKLEEGRFPEAKSEVAVERWFLDKIKSDGKLGDRIEITGKEYTLVGILNDTYTNQSEGTGELLTYDSGENKDQRILLVELNPDKNLQKNIDELKRLSDEGSTEENQLLIMTQGQNMPQGMISIIIIIIGIVVISTIAVIYNAFQIGVVDRVKQFGLLRAVGSTPKQIRKIIFREAALLASIGIPIGLGFGIAALYGIDLAFKIIGGGNLTLIYPKISVDVVILSILIGLASIFISALLPALYAGKISPLVAISSRSSITMEKLKRRKGFLMGKIFGYEGALASKNIKRNRKRYRITVFSIVISVTLFISFKSFMDMSLNVYSDTNESNKMHFSLLGKGSAKMEESIIEKINKLPQVDDSYRVFNAEYFEAAVDRTKEIREIKEIDDVYKDISYKGENKTLIRSSMVVYDDKSLEAARGYLKEGTIDIESLNNENGVIIIGKNIIRNPKTDKNFYGPIINLRAGDEILLQLSEFTNEGNEKYEFGERKVVKVKVLAVLEDEPFNFKGNQNGIKLITTKEVAERLGSKNIKPDGLNIKLKDPKLEKEAKKAIENIISPSNNLRLINIMDQNRSNKAVILMVKILLYGFVIVVSLIGSVNIINTLTTNIILRRREFAALKSIGLTQRGLRKMISLEGILYGIMGSLYGSVIGTMLSYLLYRGVSDVREQSYKLPLDSILIAAAGAMIIGYLSVLTPVKRMKRDNLIEAVREEY